MSFTAIVSVPLIITATPTSPGLDDTISEIVSERAELSRREPVFSFLPLPELTDRPPQASAVMQRKAIADINIRFLFFMMNTVTSMIDNLTSVFNISSTNYNYLQIGD